jgi:hypothetical protein
MAWFAVLFGIINLLIAYGVIRLYARATAHEQRVPPQARDAPIADGQRSENSLSPSPIAVEASQTNPNQQRASGKLAPVERASAAQAPTQAQSAASEWQDQLQSLGQRISYARLVGEKHLAKDAAAQLRDWAVTWQRQLNLELKDSPESLDADQVEMCLAQIESTVSNLDAVSWDDAVGTILGRIDREFATLEKAARDLRLGEPVEC